MTPIYNPASIAKFQKNPNVATIRPPINGPIILVPGMVMTLVAYALLIAFGGTELAIKACLTGILTDSHDPAIKA